MFQIGLIPVKQPSPELGDYGLVIVPPKGISPDFIPIATNLKTKEEATSLVSLLARGVNWKKTIARSNLRNLIHTAKENLNWLRQRSITKLSNSFDDSPEIIYGNQVDSLQRAGVKFSHFIKNHNGKLRSVQALQDLPQKDLHLFQAQSGFFKGSDGQTWIRILVDRSDHEEIYIIGDFNDWLLWE